MYVAALSMMTSIVFGPLVRLVWLPLSYSIRSMEVSTSVGGQHKMLWRVVVCLSLICPIISFYSCLNVKRLMELIQTQFANHRSNGCLFTLYLLMKPRFTMLGFVSPTFPH